MCGSCGVRAVPVAEAINYPYSFPIQEVNSRSVKCKFMALYCASPSKVNEALEPIGVKIENMDRMIALAKYHDEGNDIAYYKVNVEALLDRIKLSPDEQNKTECNLVCTY